MNDYSELVESLREDAEHIKGFFEQTEYGQCGDLLRAAADAIEELQAKVKALESQLSVEALKSLDQMRGVVEAQEASVTHSGRL